MKTYNRICIKDIKIEDGNGDVFELKRGQEYITSPANKCGKVTVFSTFWVPVSTQYFAGEQVFTD